MLGGGERCCGRQWALQSGRGPAEGAVAGRAAGAGASSGARGRQGAVPVHGGVDRVCGTVQAQYLRK